MTVTCVLCKQILVGTQPQGPQIIDENRGAMEYQAAILLLMGHFAERHRDYLATLEMMSQNYAIHLVAKLATSSDERFEQEREQARNMVYWTLYGRFNIQDQVQEPPKLILTQ